MPVIVQTPEPCAKQRETMEALGFNLTRAEGDFCCWGFTAFGGNGLPPYDFKVYFHPEDQISIGAAVARIIKDAKQAGDDARLKAIRNVLNL